MQEIKYYFQIHPQQNHKVECIVKNKQLHIRKMSNCLSADVGG